MSDWQHAAENLVRHANGIYYLRAKVRGKVIRVSLKVRDLRIAKIKRDERLAKERAAAGKRLGAPVRTLRDAVAVVRRELVERPHVAEKTRSYGKSVARILETTLPLAAHGATWSQAEAAKWWQRMTRKYSPSVANRLLSAIRRLAAVLIEGGVRADDPTRGFRPMPGRKAHRRMPGKDDMDAIVHHIRTRGKRLCLESSRMVACLAFSGMRHGELRALDWSDVGPEWITVGADGDTKSRRFRQVPVSAPLRAVLGEMRLEGETGRLFAMGSPRRALGSAVKALTLPPMRVHDLRHFFATWCIERGVDIPTVAKWLGHADGGALAMKTYGHIRDDHSLEAVKLLG